MTYIAQLADIADLKPELVGEKARRLGAMLNLNYNVPTGFCITTVALEAFLIDNGCKPVIKQLLRTSEEAEPSELEKISSEISNLFDRSAFPNELVTSIEDACGGSNLIGQDEMTPVVVRSSAIAEDLPGATFAGQYRSILFTSGIPNILNAIKQCWASLWTARAIFYRRAKQIEEENASMAVLVQLAIDSRTSGIVFTIDPVTGKDNIVINSTWGLGSKAASGEYDVDTFIIRRQGRCVIQSAIVNKSLMMKPNDNGLGTIEVHVPSKLVSEPSLRTVEIDNLVKASLDIERFFGAPQDIEWAFNGGGLWILQTRPVVYTAESFPIEWERKSDRRIVWTRGAGITERLVDPVTPMSFSLFQKMVRTGWNAAMRRLPLPMLEGDAELRLFNHYLYWNIDITAKPKLRRLIPFAIKLLHTLVTGVGRWNRRLPNYLSDVEELNSFDLEMADLPQLMVHLDDVCVQFADSFVWEVHLGTALEIFGDLFLKVIPRLTGFTAEDAAVLLQGLGNKTLEMGRGLWQLAETIRSTPSLYEVFNEGIGEDTFKRLQRINDGEEWLESFYKFLDDFGHHSAKDDWFFPNWSQDPIMVLKILRGKLALPHQDFDQILECKSMARVNTANSMRSRLRKQPLRRFLFNQILFMAYRWLPLKEDRQFYIKLTCRQLRLTIHEIGKRLVHMGVVTRGDNVFFLSLGELNDVVDNISSGKQVDLTELVKSRRVEWDASLDLSPPPRITGDLVKDSAGEHSGNRRVIKGTPASPGVTTGLARVIHSPEQFDQFLPGEILVTQAANPCWVPLFSLAKAIVTNYGGLLCHSALLAREFGVPAVVGAPFSTRVIQNGDVVTVDGTRGIVQVY